MLYLCDNHALLKAVKRWLGKVGSTRRKYFTGSNQRAQKRDNSRSSDVSDKMKAHRGEPVNNEADIQADTAVSSKGVLM